MEGEALENKSLKAQANIEFIGGFFLFLVIVTYLVFSLISELPPRYAAIEENTLRLEAWAVSERLMNLIGSRGVVEDSKLPAFSDCVGHNYNDAASRGNYTSVKSLLNVSDSQQVHITLEEFPVAILDSGNSTLRSGAMSIDGSAYAIEARNTSAAFNETKLWGGAAWSGIGESIAIGVNNYLVAGIGTAGDFVIFKRTIIDCGPSLATSEQQAEIRRYSTYRGRLVRITMTYW